MSTYLPPLHNLPASREMTDVFRGYNHTARPGDGEWYDMWNLTSAMFPALATRQPRGFGPKLRSPRGLFAHGKLCWADGTEFFYDGVKRGDVKDSRKQFVAMGAYVLIWPDKMCYNTETGEFFSLEAASQTSGTVSFTLCRLDGSAYEDYAAGDKAPGEPEDGQLWVDTSQSPSVLKQYSAQRLMWVSMPTTYVKISAEGIGAGFRRDDGVTVSGCADESLCGDVILMDAEDGFILATGIIREAYTQEGTVTVERKAPDMDFLTECNNRVWGCSSAAHEVYACKLGDPTNWRCYAGLSTDSYAVTIGSPGDFTGACTHLGYVMFFKEQIIHKVYGYKPSNFEVTDTHARGVEKGSERSLVIVNETLFYKSAGGVCAYNAALPVDISMALGGERYRFAAAGAWGDRYYVSMRDSGGMPHLFVFDTARGLWHHEDDTEALDFAQADGTLVCLRGDGQLLVMPADPGEAGLVIEQGEKIQWAAETGDFGLSSPDHKYVSKLQLRLEVEQGARVRVLARYDCQGAFEEIARINPTGKRSVTVPVVPRRCDTMRLRLEGHGGFRLHALTKTMEAGSNI